MKNIREFLLEHADSEPISFHMPGHKGSRIFRKYEYEEFLDNLVDMDITEIPGADNLFQPEGIIAELMGRYKALYESRKSYLLVNGSTGGLIASVLATTHRGGSIIAARNCHKSIYSAFVLGDLTPEYAYPEVIDPYGISGPITPEEIQACMERAPEAEAVILPSPNYYGICSDIKAIAEVVHAQGKVLIVDQAHGAHLKFFGWEQPSMAAEDLGADIVINSIHKTLASFTQTSLANVMTDRVDLDRMEEALGRMESSSPSYILMASLDVAAELIEYHGQDLISQWQENVADFYEAIEEVEGVRLMDHPLMDRTKINIDMSQLGVSGQQLEAMLRQLGIYPEMVTGDIVMCMTGIGNERMDYLKLLEVLQKISQSLLASGVSLQEPDPEQKQPWSFPRLEMAGVPEETQKVALEEAAGKVCAKTLIPYPPGIPIICPGEVITPEIANYVKAMREAGENVIGVDEEGRILVGK